MLIFPKYMQKRKIILTHFPKVGLCDLHPVCVSVYPPFSTFEWLNFTNPSHQSVCLYVYLSYRC
jgi:hypothetical protein